MKSIKLLLLLSFILLNSIVVCAQNGSVSITPIYDTTQQADVAQGNFCAVLQKLMADAAHNFTLAKGKVQETSGDLEIWTTNIGLPGMVTSSLMFGDKWHYEGIAYEGYSPDDMRSYYSKYKSRLAECLAPLGYYSSSERDTIAAVAQYPKVIYKKSDKDNDVHAPYVTLQADYIADAKVYMITVSVWQ